MDWFLPVGTLFFWCRVLYWCHLVATLYFHGELLEYADTVSSPTKFNIIRCDSMTFNAWFREYEGLSRASGFNSDTGRFAQLQFWLEPASEAREFFLTNSGANGSCSDYKDAKDAICAEFWTTGKVRAVVNSFQRPSQSQREGEDVVSFHRRFLKSLAEHTRHGLESFKRIAGPS